MTRILTNQSDTDSASAQRVVDESLGNRPRSSAPMSEAGQYFLGLSRQLAAAGNLNDDTSMTIGVTSAARHEGVTTVAVNLASAASCDLSGRVLLVDANITAPCGAEVAGARQGTGLADLLTNNSGLSLDDCLQSSSQPNLDVLAAGSPEHCKDLAVSGDRVRQVMREMTRQFQMVVFDLPTASELTPCFALARSLDGVVMVVEAERTRSKAVIRAKRQLIQSGVELLGVVFNKRREHVPGWIYNRI